MGLNRLAILHELIAAEAAVPVIVENGGVLVDDQQWTSDYVKLSMHFPDNFVNEDAAAHMMTFEQKVLAFVGPLVEGAGWQAISTSVSVRHRTFTLTIEHAYAATTKQGYLPLFN